MTIIKLHDLRPAIKENTNKTRFGRGEASKGKTSGRGTKGTKARKHVPLIFEGGQMPIHMRLPKLKGFNNHYRKFYQVVNIKDITTSFPKGGNIDINDLVNKGLVKKNKLTKILGTGKLKLKVKINITANKFSRSAYKAILSTGGSATVIN